MAHLREVQNSEFLPVIPAKERHPVLRYGAGIHRPATTVHHACARENGYWTSAPRFHGHKRNRRDEITSDGVFHFSPHL